MHVLFLAAYYPPEKTADTHLEQDLIEGMAKRGWKVDIVCPTPTRGCSKEDIQRYKRIKKETQYDGKVIVHRFWAPQEKTKAVTRALRYLFNIVLGRFFGITGVIVATILTMFFCSFIWRSQILFYRYFQKSSKRFYIMHGKMMLTSSIVLVVCFYFCNLIGNDGIFSFIGKQKVKHWYDVTVYDNLNSFVEVLAKADDRATHLKEFLKSDEGIKYEIEEAIKEAVENASFDIERKSYYCIDESDVINISDIEYETKILDIDDNFATVSVAAKCVVKIWYKYTDEDQSYWDREDQCYLWQMVVELEDTYPISFNMDIKLDISGWLPSVEERQDILFEEYVEMPSTIVLYEDDLLEVEDLTEYPSEDDDDYNICPDCGERYDIENDGGNGFCIKCAPNH